MNKLDDTKVIVQSLTFTVPHVLINYTQNGRPVWTLRQGASVQIDHTISTDYYDEPVSERPFLIKAKNKINFGNLLIEVLNDEIEGVTPSSPTASEYMSKVGQRVLVSFRCTKQALGDKDVYKIVRSTIILP